MSFGFHSVEHAFASVAKDIVHTSSIFSLVASRIERAAPEIEAVTGAIYPPAVLIERAAFSLLGNAAKCASTMDDAALAKGMNLSLDKESIAELRQIAKYLQNHLSSMNSGSPLIDQAASSTANKA